MFAILYTAVLTLLAMMLLHHLYVYLKTNLTIPKVYNMIDVNQLKYAEIHKTLEKENIHDYLKQFKKTNINI